MYPKGALQVFEKELETCHKQNDLKRALEILVILAESDVVFDYVEYDETGNNGTYFDPHISACFLSRSGFIHKPKAKDKRYQLKIMMDMCTKHTKCTVIRYR